ncbi:MAG: hypothetical protein EOP45_12905 [Sphingobacteriaceae bacterium]|nr:MAG: hypothetical protein EOP45_12905 [Sphingobacteriaceae bacterium]
MNKLLIFLIITFCKIHIAEAKVQDNINKFLDNLGMATNITGGGAYKDQMGGYYTGGSLYARAQVQNTQLASLQAPSFNSGCGGIDLFMGGMSFISASQFLNSLRHIPSNAVGYGFNLALQTMAPQVYNTMQKLNDIAREVNSMNINSCEMAANTLGGIWPKSDASSRYLCNVMSTSNKSRFRDWAESRQNCGAGGLREEINKTKTSEFENILGDEFNLVWSAIKNNNFLAKDQELRELFMSITGTIVGKKEGRGRDTKIKQIHYAPLALNHDLIEVLLHGLALSTSGTAETYKCDENKNCLNISKQVLASSRSVSLVPKIEDILQSIANKASTYADQLTIQEKGLIEVTRIPIYKIIMVQNAYRGGSSILNVSEFAEVIAHDVILEFMEQVIDTVNQNLKELESVQIDGTIINHFKSELRDTRKLIIDKRHGIYQKLYRRSIAKHP